MTRSRIFNTILVALLRPRHRHSFAVRWLRRLATGLLVLFSLGGVVIAVPPVRDFAIDQIIYQGDFFFPVHQHATVVRLVPKPHGGLEATTVAVRSGQIESGWILSPVLHGDRRSYRIYLPPSYSDPANRHRRYPVVYLIHGSPGNPTSWLRGAHANIIANEEIAAGTAQPTILAMPDLNGGAWRDTECVNKWDGTDNEMTYFIHDVVPYVDAHYRTIPNARYRAIGGLSSGGYCAYNLALRNPGIFNTVFSISGYFHALRGEVFGFDDPFGHNPRFIAANSPDDYIGRVPGVRHMHLFILDSTADWGYTGYATSFDRELTRLRIPHVLLLRHPSGFHLWDHSWAFWSSAFRQTLPLISQTFGH